jgi:hypothetical protein
MLINPSTRTSGAKQCSVARMMTVRLPVVLSMLARVQRLFAVCAFEAEVVPIFPERRLPFGCTHPSRPRS